MSLHDQLDPKSESYCRLLVERAVDFHLRSVADDQHRRHVAELLMVHSEYVLRWGDIVRQRRAETREMREALTAAAFGPSFDPASELRAFGDVERAEDIEVAVRMTVNDQAAILDSRLTLDDILLMPITHGVEARTTRIVQSRRRFLYRSIWLSIAVAAIAVGGLILDWWGYQFAAAGGLGFIVPTYFAVKNYDPEA